MINVTVLPAKAPGNDCAATCPDTMTSVNSPTGNAKLFFHDNSSIPRLSNLHNLSKRASNDTPNYSYQQALILRRCSEATTFQTSLPQQSVAKIGNRSRAREVSAAFGR